jgi:hypothetical protein
MLPNPPVYDQAIKGHVITFKEAVSLFVEVETIDEPIDVSGNTSLEAIIRDFLSSSARYFSRPLEYSQFERRCSHKWEGGVSITFRSTDGIKYGLEWQLQKVIFYANRYEVFWSLEAIQPVVIPLPTAAGAPVTDSPPSPVVKEVETEAIPLRTPTVEDRERLKRGIRHARLRIALAQLRAERLAEKYYRRYGCWDGADEGEDGESDSDLSVDSVGPPAAVATAENIGSR